MGVGDRDAAFESARKAISDNPNAVDAYLVMAELAFDTGHAELVGKMLGKARTLAPLDPAVELVRVSVALNSTRLRMGARILTTAWQAFDQGDLYTSRRLVERSIATEPRAAEAHFLLALICRRLTRLTADYEQWCRQGDVLKALRTAVELAPRCLRYHQELAMEFRQTGLLPEALRAYRALLELAPQSSDGWFGLGETAFASGDIEAAAEAFHRGTEQAPADKSLLLWLGYAFKRQGRLFEALSLHQRAFDGPKHWTSSVDPHLAESFSSCSTAHRGLAPNRFMRRSRQIQPGK